WLSAVWGVGANAAPDKPAAATAPTPPITALRRDRIGRPKEPGFFIVIAVLLEGINRPFVRAFGAHGHRTLGRCGSYQRMRHPHVPRDDRCRQRLARGPRTRGFTVSRIGSDTAQDVPFAGKAKLNRAPPRAD